MGEPLLEVIDLHARFQTAAGSVRAVEGVSLRVDAGEAVGVVGESGSGKSTLAASILKLMPEPGAIVSGRVLFRGVDILHLDDEATRRVRGNQIAVTFQDAAAAMNPLMSIGSQVEEALHAHGPVGGDSGQEVVKLLRRVRLPGAELRVFDYPHQLSGGMKQRVMLAVGTANDPALLIADEATTGLDTTSQAQIVLLLEELRRELGMAILLITHNMGLLARLCQRVVVMYAGRVVEEGGVDQIFADPQHPYTKGLVGAVPRLDGPRRLVAVAGFPPDPLRLPSACKFHPRCAFREDRCVRDEPRLEEVAKGQSVRCWLPTGVRPRDDQPAAGGGAADRPGIEAVESAVILSVEDVSKHFPARGRRVARALDGVTLHLRRGETLGLIGESGSGKSTLARIVTRLLPPTTGRVLFEGEDITRVGGRRLQAVRRRLQVVFQDPYSSLNPRMRVGRSIAEPLCNFRIGDKQQRRGRVAELMAQVGLHPALGDRYPHELSGGQRQRVVVARALATNPRVVICDEPVSSLDVSIQAQILNMLKQLQNDLGLSYLFISHDVGVVRHMADRLAVMHLGRIVETGSASRVLTRPQHPYTRVLIDSVASPDPAAERARRPVVLEGEPPSPIDPPTGCTFHSRCAAARVPGICDTEEPDLLVRDGGSATACHFPPGP